MKYQKPFNEANPNASYVNGNPGTGTAGSIPPAKAIEDPQRELDDLITRSGITPSEADLGQVAKAIQNGKISYGAAGGTANALTATLSPVPPALVVGMVIRVLIGATNTGAATINVNGLGARNIVRANGIAVTAGDLTAGDVVQLIYDNASQFRMVALGRSDVRAAAFGPVTTVKFTTVGATTWTVPAGVYSILTRVWGGGGGGGYANTNPVKSSAPSGGGAAGYAERRWSVTPGQVIDILVGAGGAPGSGSPLQPGQPGTLSQVTVAGTQLQALPGQGGLNTSAADTVANASSGGGHNNADFGIRGEDGHIGSIPGSGGIGSGGSGAACPLGGAETPGGRGSPGAAQVPGGGGGATSDYLIAGAAGARGEIHITYSTP